MHMTTLEVHNDRTNLHWISGDLLDAIDRHLRYPTDMAAEDGWRPPTKEDDEDDRNVWDGWVHMLHKTTKIPPWFPSGLLQEVVRSLTYWNIPHQVIDQRKRPPDELPEFPAVPLRDYQMEAAQRGVDVGMGVFDMVPRSGKTRTMLEVQRRLNQPCLWMAPTDRIVSQTLGVVDGLLGEGYAHHVVGSKGAQGLMGARLLLCTAATANILPQEVFDSRRCIVVDEWHHCFSGATLVLTAIGPKPIREIRVGDKVWSDGPGGPSLKVVTRVWRRQSPETWLRVRTTHGIFEVTDEHGVYVSKWRKQRAGDLRAGSSLRVLQVRQGDQAPWSILAACEALSGSGVKDTGLSRLWSRGIGQVLRWASDCLFGQKPDGQQGDTYEGDGQTLAECGLQRAAVFEDERGQQPGQGCACEAPSIGKLERSTDQGALWSGALGKGAREDFGREGGPGDLRPPWVCGGVQGLDGETKGQRKRPLVRARFGSPAKESGCRDRRVQPFDSEGCRPTQGRVFGSFGMGSVQDPRRILNGWLSLGQGEVLSIERVKARSDQVYDLEVSGNHNYFVEGGVLVSNSASPMYSKIFKRCRHIYHRFGMTGTHFRSGGDAMAMHGLLGHTLYKVTAEDMLRRGYLVPTKVCFLPVDTARLPSNMGAFNTGHGKVGIHENKERNWLAAWSALQLHAAGKRVMILVGTKAQGKLILHHLRQFLPPRGPGRLDSAEFVSTDTQRPRIKLAIEGFLAGSVGVLVGTSLLGEGVDLPVADALVYARGEKAEVSLTQNMYRVGTACPGKTEALMVDFADRHQKRLLEHAQERARVYYESPTFTPSVLPQVTDFFAWAGVGNSELVRYRV